MACLAVCEALAAQAPDVFALKSATKFKKAARTCDQCRELKAHLNIGADWITTRRKLQATVADIRTSLAATSVSKPKAGSVVEMRRRA